MKKTLVMVFMILFAGVVIKAAEPEDPYIWLEEVSGAKPLEWVKERNAESVSVLEKVKGFESVYKNILDILDSDKKIPYTRREGKFLYNFWKDAGHPRGILRRTTIGEYMKESPEWETVLDVDMLASKENENWVYKGSQFLFPDHDRALISLSRGGSDATVVREFDVEKKEFVENGFSIPEAKSMVSWINRDNVFLGTDFGKGSLTESGYPAIVKILKRGNPVSSAETVFEADRKSVYAYAMRLFSGGDNFDLIVDARTFYTSDYYHPVDGKLKKLNIPPDADIAGYFKGQLIIRLKSDLNAGNRNFVKGSVLIGKAADILEDNASFISLIEPGERLSVESVSTTKNLILVTVLDNVVSRLYQFRMDAAGNWKKEIVTIKDRGSLSVYDSNEQSDDYFVNFENFLTPGSVYLVAGETGEVKRIKSLPDLFDAEPYTADQYEAVSADGTRIPYFIIMRKGLELNGMNPTLLYGYGGFLISETPFYSGTIGKEWLEKGGVYVLANIRGGGEFGPEWHQAALKKNRKKSYEDFIAIAEDLISRKITSPEKLGIKGGSNGGLLVGAVFVMRPDLFNAVVCQVPLLDMKRYTKLLAGASWAAEYGDPDIPDMWEYIKTYSPYHNVKKGVKYPEVLFTTSTKDDRVHPGHARKMVAKMKAQGHKVYYYENTEGGHAGAANNKQRAYMEALGYAYLYMKLMGR